ncbi:MAG: inorganic phosphate transporter [Candidatus Hodarchaeales archaeon]|jgi:PiT family inorganic phosphate transporter
MLELLVVAPFLGLAFILAIGVGANDETFAPVVGAHKLTPLQCVSIGSVLAIAGALTLGNNVAGTVGKGIVKGDFKLDSDALIFSVLLAMSIVLILSSGFGLPISSTHAMVGSIIGLAIWEAFSEPEVVDLLIYVNQSKIITIILSWFISPAIGLAGSYVIFKIVDAATVKYTKGLDDVSRNENIAANLLLVFVVITAISRGGNDVANAVSPLMEGSITPLTNWRNWNGCRINSFSSTCP